MTGLDAAALLAGPRGRRLCLEYACVVDETVRTTSMLVAHRLDPGQGTAQVLVTPAGNDCGAVPGGRQRDVADVAEAIDDAPLPPVQNDDLLCALGAAVSNARYWQEPDGEDVLAALPEMRRPLGRVAEHLTASAAAGWWSATFDGDDQWAVVWQSEGTAHEDHGAAAVQLARWREDTVAGEVWAARERPRDPREPYSGEWWATPPASLTRSTRSLGQDGAVGLWLIEDSPGCDTATVTPVEGSAHVLELDGPDAWTDLCRGSPIDVTASRRHDWYRATGQDERWLVPDWSAVAHEWDAVHLTVTGYLATAGRALPVDDGWWTVLAGWSPDETYWLTDVVRAVGDPVTWVRDDDVWRPVG